MSIRSVGEKRRNQIETLKSKKEVLLLKQRRKQALATKNRKAELIKLRNEIINDGSINKELSLRNLAELERQSKTLSETEFQKRLSKVKEKKPTIIILYER